MNYFKTDQRLLAGLSTRSYRLTLSTVADNSQANEESLNIVRATLVNSGTQTGVSNQTLSVYVNGPATYPSSVITNNAGEANIYISSSTAGPMAVTVVLLSNNSINDTIATNFSAGYPIRLPAYQIFLGAAVPINKFLANYTLIEGHLYLLTSTRTPSDIRNCSVNYALNIVSGGFACVQGLGNDLLYLSNDISWFKPIRSGSGAFFYSQRYAFFGVAGDSSVQLIDYGPNSSFVALPPSDYQNLSVPDVPAESIEPAETLDPGDPEADNGAAASQ